MRRLFLRGPTGRGWRGWGAFPGFPPWSIFGASLREAGMDGFVLSLVRKHGPGAPSVGGEIGCSRPGPPALRSCCCVSGCLSNPLKSSDMSNRNQAPDLEGLTQPQIETIERFEVDYNFIDQHLRKDLGLDRTETFAQVVKGYSRKHPGWRDADLLRMVGDLRNAIVHGKTEPFRHIAVPTPTISRELTRCRDRLQNPILVIPKFQRNVERLLNTDTLDHVLRIVAERNYSQFPVYDDKRFKGLLTENGITRWLARNVDQELFGVKDILVSEVLRLENERENYKFVPRNTRLDELAAAFAREAELEAVLITHQGKDSEAPIGIATRWDIVHPS